MDNQFIGLYFGWLVWFVLVVLSVYRLALLISQDILLDGFRKRIGKWASAKTAQKGKLTGTLPWYLAELINCPHCTGVWFALVGAAWLVSIPAQNGGQPTLINFLVIWLAVAGAQAFLYSLGGR